jgi:caffeoyl-CoA O-methyltransferase
MCAFRTIQITERLYDYITDHSMPLDDIERDLVKETAALGSDLATMQIGPDQGALLTLLTRLMGARRAVEVGTFTGYSALCIARGMPADGHLLCCDVSEEWTGMAKRAWTRAGVADRIELRIAPAIETLRSLPEDPVLDLAFIDADKDGYIDYYEELLRRLRPGGVILADNVLWSGQVADPAADHDENTAAVCAFNDHVAADERVEAVMLSIGDGLTLARKRD